MSLKHTPDNNWKIQAMSWVVLANYGYFKTIPFAY